MGQIEKVSHEAIYRALLVQERGALKKERLEHLRRTRGMRRSRHYTQKTPIRGRIVDALPISERPGCVPRIGQCRGTGEAICCSVMPRASLQGQ